MEKIKGKEIINKIFAIRNILEKSGNKDIFQKFELTISSYVPLKMIFYGLETIVQMKNISNESIASLGQKIQKLEKMGLVVRKLNKGDKRKWNFKISKKGEETLQKVERKFSKTSEKLFSNFSEKEKDNVWRLLGKIENNLEP